MKLTIDHISKQFSDHTAVNNVSLDLTPGIWGLLGANGAGKTTLIRMLTDITTPSSGQILYDGVPITTLKESYRDILGYLPQEFGFYPSFTVNDYLEYMAALKGLPTDVTKKKITELLERLALMDVRRKKIAKLSGGMRRRVGIAQALLNDPEVLILDEPTSGLDPSERIRLRNLLTEFAQNRIVLISTHIVSDVENIANQIAIMKEGALLPPAIPNNWCKRLPVKSGRWSFQPKTLSNMSKNCKLSISIMKRTAISPFVISLTTLYPMTPSWSHRAWKTSSFGSSRNP